MRSGVLGDVAQLGRPSRGPRHRLLPVTLKLAPVRFGSGLRGPAYFHGCRGAHSAPQRPPPRTTAPRIAFKCGWCDGACPSNIALMAHTEAHFEREKVHSGETAYASQSRGQSAWWCQICEVGFTDAEEESRHWDETHPILPEAPYACSACRFRTSARSDLRKHFASQHRGGRHLQCPLCLGLFSADTRGRHPSAGAFHRHIIAHLVEPAIPCQRCRLVFCSDAELRRHVGKDHDLSFDGLEMFAPPGDLPGRRLLRPLLRTPSLDEAWCLECGHNMSEPRHLRGEPMPCPLPDCGLQSSCRHALQAHTRLHARNIRRSAFSRRTLHYPRRSQIRCLCGYQSPDLAATLEHVADCEGTVTVTEAVSRAPTVHSDAALARLSLERVVQVTEPMEEGDGDDDDIIITFVGGPTAGSLRSCEFLPRQADAAAIGSKYKWARTRGTTEPPDVARPATLDLRVLRDLFAAS